MKFYKMALPTAIVLSLINSFASAQSVQKGNVSPKKSTSAIVSDLPLIDIRGVQTISASLKESEAGDQFAQRGTWDEAAHCYQQALELWNANTDALYGIAQCYGATGDTAEETRYYRSAIYSDNPADGGFHENHINRLMEYVLLLSQSNQIDEGISVYNHAVRLLDIRDGGADRRVVLPQYGYGSNLWPDIAQHLQAMAHVALGIDAPNAGDKVYHFREANRIWPDSAVAYYYTGEFLKYQPGYTTEAMDAFAKAVQYGTPDMKLYVSKAYKKGTGKFMAAAKNVKL